VADAGVGQHALDVGLAQGDEVTQGHGDDRQGNEKSHPAQIPAEGRQRRYKDPHQDGKTGRLGAH